MTMLVEEAGENTNNEEGKKADTVETGEKVDNEQSSNETCGSNASKHDNSSGNEAKKQKKTQGNFNPVCVYDDPSNKSNNFFEVEKVVGVRNKNGRIYYKVRWRGCDPTKDTWEPSENLCDSAFNAIQQQQNSQFGNGNMCENVECDNDKDKNKFFQNEAKDEDMELDPSNDEKKIDELLAMFDDSDEDEEVVDNKTLKIQKEKEKEKEKEKQRHKQHQNQRQNQNQNQAKAKKEGKLNNRTLTTAYSTKRKRRKAQPTPAGTDPWKWTDDEQVKFREIERIEVHDPDARDRVTDARLSGIPVILIGHSGWPQFASRWLKETKVAEESNVEMEMEQKQQVINTEDVNVTTTSKVIHTEVTDETSPTSVIREPLSALAPGAHSSPMTITPTSATSASEPSTLAISAPTPTATEPPATALPASGSPREVERSTSAPVPAQASGPSEPTLSTSPTATTAAVTSTTETTDTMETISIAATNSEVTTTQQTSLRTPTAANEAKEGTETTMATTVMPASTAATAESTASTAATSITSAIGATTTEGKAATEMPMPEPTLKRTFATADESVPESAPVPTPTPVPTPRPAQALASPVSASEANNDCPTNGLEMQQREGQVVDNTTSQEQQWLDLSKPHELLIDRMIADIGHESVPVIRRNYNERKPIQTEITASAFIKRSWSETDNLGTSDTTADEKKAPAKKGGLLYLHQWQFPLSETASRILCGEKKTKPLPNNILGEDLLKYWLDSETCNGDSPFQYIFMGGEGTMSKLHKDAGGLEISIAPIIGRKEVVLVHRSDGIGCLYHLDANIDKVNLHTFPMLSQARIWHAVLEPGEILLMPQGTYHQARNVTPCLSYSRFHLDTVNLKPFLDSLLDGDAPEIQHDYVIWNSTTELRDRIDKFSESVRNEEMNIKKSRNKIKKNEIVLTDDIIRSVDTLRQLRNICRELAGRLRLEMERKISGGNNIKSGIQQSMPDSDDRDPAVWDQMVDDVDETLHDFRYRCSFPRPNFKLRRGEFKKKRKRTNESSMSSEPITGVVSVESTKLVNTNDDNPNPFIRQGATTGAIAFAKGRRPNPGKIQANRNGGSNASNNKATAETTSSGSGDDKLNNAVNCSLPDLFPDEIALSVSDFTKLKVGDGVSIKFHGKRVDCHICNCKILEIVDMMRAAYLSYEDYSSCYHDEYQPIEQLRIPLPGEGSSSLPEVRPEDLKPGLVVIDRVWGNKIEDYRAVVQSWKVATFYRVQFQVETPPDCRSKYLILQRWITRDCVLKKQDSVKDKTKTTSSNSNLKNRDEGSNDDEIHDDNSSNGNRKAKDDNGGTIDGKNDKDRTIDIDDDNNDDNNMSTSDTDVGGHNVDEGVDKNDNSSKTNGDSEQLGNVTKGGIGKENNNYRHLDTFRKDNVGVGKNDEGVEVIDIAAKDNKGVEVIEIED